MKISVTEKFAEMYAHAKATRTTHNQHLQSVDGLIDGKPVVVVLALGSEAAPLVKAAVERIVAQMGEHMADATCRRTDHSK